MDWLAGQTTTHWQTQAAGIGPIAPVMAHGQIIITNANKYMHTTKELKLIEKYNIEGTPGHLTAGCKAYDGTGCNLASGDCLATHYPGKFQRLLAMTDRLEYLRQQIRNENISYSEVSELELLGMAGIIDKNDMELLEAAGVPEFKD